MAIAILATLGMSSCLGSSEESSSSSDYGHCAINTVTLGTLSRTVYTKSSKTGNDTSYAVSVAGSGYKMYIDQMNLEIYNPDSLPINTHVESVIFSVFSGDGDIYYRTKSGRDTLLTTKDSIDFTTPRYFTCYSNDGKQKKTYKVSVNVHKSSSEQFSWTTVCDEAEAFDGVTEQKAFALGGGVVVMAIKDGKPAVIKNSEANPSQWTVTSLTEITYLDPYAVQQKNASLYVVDNGVLKMSADGVTWTNVSTNVTLDRLVAAGYSELYGYKDGKLYFSTDDENWAEDTLVDDASLLPANCITSVWNEMSFNKDFTYVVIGGITKDPYIWKKTVDINGVNTDAWTIYPQIEDAGHHYPALPQSVMMSYDEKLYYLGLENDSLSNFYISSDGGRNWIAQTSGYIHPYEMRAASFSAVVDPEDYMWIMCAPTGKVIKGRLNRLGYATNQTIFLKNTKR